MSATKSVPVRWIIPTHVERQDGARGAAGTEFQLICGAGPYELDLLVRGRRQVLDLVGQVTRGDRIFEPVAELVLELIDCDGLPLETSTETDTFGEFALESESAGPVGLRLGIGADAPCVLIDGEEF
ncbi:MAG: hypothetical protein OER88_03125 [Planctomycetota bacterium]|nr:hypothetical protein [Planctomycetota bacterium]